MSTCASCGVGEGSLHADWCPRSPKFKAPTNYALPPEEPPRHSVGGVPCAIVGCKRGQYHDHPELRDEPGQTFVVRHEPPAPRGYGSVSPEMAAATKLVAEKDAEIARLKDAAAARAADQLLGHVGAELLDHSCDLLRRARPILADSAHHPEVAALLRDIRDFLEPPAPAAKKPSVADTVLAHAFGAEAAPMSPVFIEGLKREHAKRAIESAFALKPLGDAGPYPADPAARSAFGESLRYVARYRAPPAP